MNYRVGIDVGSTTLKTVILDEKDNIIEKSYQRHFSKVREKTLEHIKSLESILKGKECRVAITGSAGLGISKEYGIPFVQEVFSTAGAVKKQYPKTDVVIELGGEDAKILFLQGSIEERMNGSCAGGTGAFIDQMASLMDMNATQLDTISLDYEKIYPIASRCGVFAKTDIQPLLNQGAKKADIAASIYQAVVEQTITGLAQGRNIEGNVLFLGGPLSFLKGLQKRFVETLHLSEKNAIFPELAPYFVALGSAYYAGTVKEIFSFEELVRILSREKKLKEESKETPLFHTQEEYQVFQERHQRVSIPEKDILNYSGKAYLGLDSGSTTIKIVLLDEEGNLLYRHYSSSKGNPVSLFLEQLKKIRELCGERIEIVSSAVTGYGEELMQAAFGVDLGIVETVAHYTAAKYFNPQVDFIIDIGGQDIKCFHIQNGNIDSILLNEACSSGCGSFLETFAKSMGYSIQEFSEKALFARSPASLGSRCTVFMNSSVKQAQKEGAGVEDISAGLARSIVKNAIYKVIRARNAEDLGKHIVVQGGTFLNDAVLRSFEQELGREVLRLNHSELMGAYGAALYAKNVFRGQSTLLKQKDLQNFEHRSVATRCNLCTNHCHLTVNHFSTGEHFISGNKCERGAGKTVQNHLPNMVAYKNQKFDSIPLVAFGRAKIGIPRVLNMYDMLPFWAALFTNLGCDVVLSAKSSRELYMKGQHTIPSDTVCYPAKLVHGHIEDLLSKDLDAIFYPCLTYAFDEGLSDNHYNCPVVAYYPELIQANIPEVEKKNYLYPHLGMENRGLLIEKLYDCFQDIIPNLTKREMKFAVEVAYERYFRYREKIREEGKRCFTWAKLEKKPTVILASRPYHIDSEINHGLDRLLNSLGFVVLTEDSLPACEKGDSQEVLNQWTYHARMYNAARFVGESEQTELIQLVSFGCGIDAITSDEIHAILAKKEKLYTQLKIDEINNLGASKIRLRSLAATMREREAI
ncbi:putative CoA-substrate-specific enzyme activase [Fusobacterium gonidiaformans 3-1-5R]|uniref:Putative CoA-substrate-specific enzyme activase n=1 Tax=Fusobacterium gonidiaformans 3-1-5R TaxID=469605 RepID=E5BEK7_9FUSO|nr:acyl-CoA dehydratase activase-related protein [Fusobacterium gonidiaformans]EFS20538.1 putative CoA-substrate-specific enzyme activase [Fusobacterium gonidiaformans 3-1-5R]